MRASCAKVRKIKRPIVRWRSDRLGRKYGDRTRGRLRQRPSLASPEPGQTPRCRRSPNMSAQRASDRSATRGPAWALPAEHRVDGLTRRVPACRARGPCSALSYAPRVNTRSRRLQLEIGPPTLVDGVQEGGLRRSSRRAALGACRALLVGGDIVSSRPELTMSTRPSPGRGPRSSRVKDCPLLRVRGAGAGGSAGVAAPAVQGRGRALDPLEIGPTSRRVGVDVRDDSRALSSEIRRLQRGRPVGALDPILALCGRIRRVIYFRGCRYEHGQRPPAHALEPCLWRRDSEPDSRASPVRDDGTSSRPPGPYSHFRHANPPHRASLAAEFVRDTRLAIPCLTTRLPRVPRESEARPCRRLRTGFAERVHEARPFSPSGRECRLASRACR